MSSMVKYLDRYDVINILFVRSDIYTFTIIYLLS